MSLWTLLIDGDVLAYRVAAACERPYCWDPGVGDEWSLHSHMEDIREGIDGSIERIKYDIEHLGFPPGHIEVYLTDSHNFRRELNPEYKSNRRGSRKPVNLKEARGYLASRYRAEMWDNLEADDCLGIRATEPAELGARIICSVDKDFLNIPEAWTWDPWKDGDKPVFTGRDEAHQHFLAQVLSGDHVDGYPGIPGVGTKTARKHLDKFGYRWQSVVDLYEKKGLTEEDALMTARMAHILHWGDYDQNSGAVDLWQAEG